MTRQSRRAQLHFGLPQAGKNLPAPVAGIKRAPVAGIKRAPVAGIKRAPVAGGKFPAPVA